MNTQATKKIVKRVEDLADAVNGMNKAMESATEAKEERVVEVTSFQKKHPDAVYIEPSMRIPTGCGHNPRYHEIHGSLEHLKEYVVGIFESQLVGATFSFDLAEIPGEDYCRWKIPTNKPIGLPRYVAKHLSTHLSWKEMKPLGRNQEPQAYHDDEVTKPFENFETKRRGTFYPINAY